MLVDYSVSALAVADRSKCQQSGNIMSAFTPQAFQLLAELEQPHM
ncbi:hypothetical protein Z949_3040 [Sulfitobacter guttiformis KCTC 32187]|uniref:Uncharacterized protein n=1 Tax=Sulfitobacter guttiformis TaxID=74349 RepID=A0A420DQM6_9RHOB|nr:hypothetical protein Z949_3040 [Sulfitobacter guttiformis KCTC 32187]RKE96480.1 hypothetical protein C8N30_1041 [Sulfitobacter guttiformis]